MQRGKRSLNFKLSNLFEHNSAAILQLLVGCVFDGCLVHFTPSLHFTSGLDGAGPSMEPRDSGDSPEAWMGFGRGILPSRHASPGASPCGGHVF